MGKVKNKPKKNGKPKAQSLPEVLTLAEAAAWLRVSEEVLHEAATMGAVPGRMINVFWVFSREALLEWINKPKGKVQNGELREKGVKFKSLLDPVNTDLGNEAFRNLIGAEDMDEDFIEILGRIRTEANRETVGVE